MPGPVWVREAKENPGPKATGDPFGHYKPYFIGIHDQTGDELPDFQWEEKESELRRTPIYDLHVKLGGRMVPFAGWEMPVVYTSIMDEHQTVRNAAGLFDVTHMGVYRLRGQMQLFFWTVCAPTISHH